MKEKNERKKTNRKEEKGRRKGVKKRMCRDVGARAGTGAGTGLTMVAIALVLCVFAQSALAAQISVAPECQIVTKGDYFTVDIYADPEFDPENPVNETLAGSHNLYFNNTLLNATFQVNGTFLSQDGNSTHIEPNEINNTFNDTHGVVSYGEYRQVSSGVTNPGVLATITFEALADGFCELWLGDLGGTSTELINVTPASIPTDINNGGMKIGLCGDVDGDEEVRFDFGDYLLLRSYVGYAPGVTISTDWAGDVDGDGGVRFDFGDYLLLRSYVGYAPGVTLNCCCDEYWV